MDMLGESLERIFNRRCHGKFSVKRMFMLVKQMLTRYHIIHERGFIHRDVKAKNFVSELTGSSEENTIFSVDVNLSKCCKESLVEKIVSYIKGNRSEIGIKVFKISTLDGTKKLERKADLEGLECLSLHFLRLYPWQGRPRRALYAHDLKVLSSKLHNHKLPKEFIEYLAHTRTLDKDQDPNYVYLRGPLRNSYKTLHITFPYDNGFDWYKKTLLMTLANCGKVFVIRNA